MKKGVSSMEQPAGTSVASARPPSASEMRQAPSPAVPAAAPDVLSHLTELWGREEPSFVGDLLEIFLADAINRVAALHRAVAAEDTRSLAWAAHALKGAGSSIGSHAVVGICQRLMSFRDAPWTDEVSQLVRELEEALARVRIELELLDANTQ